MACLGNRHHLTELGDDLSDLVSICSSDDASVDENGGGGEERGGTGKGERKQRNEGRHEPGHEIRSPENLVRSPTSGRLRLLSPASAAGEPNDGSGVLHRLRPVFCSFLVTPAS